MPGSESVDKKTEASFSDELGFIDNAHEILAEWRGKDRGVVTFPMLDNVALCNLVVAWAQATVVWMPMPEEDPCLLPEDQQWEWMWEWSSHKTYELSLLSGLTPAEVALQFARAKGLRLIFPDGSICPSAEDVVERMIRQRMHGSELKKPSGGFSA